MDSLQALLLTWYSSSSVAESFQSKAKSDQASFKSLTKSRPRSKVKAKLSRARLLPVAIKHDSCSAFGSVTGRPFGFSWLSGANAEGVSSSRMAEDMALVFYKTFERLTIRCRVQLRLHCHVRSTPCENTMSTGQTLRFPITHRVPLIKTSHHACWLSQSRARRPLRQQLTRQGLTRQVTSAGFKTLRFAFSRVCTLHTQPSGTAYSQMCHQHKLELTHRLRLRVRK